MRLCLGLGDLIDEGRSILGPALGGSLAQPCESYPSIFKRHTLFDRFPFLLPNLVCSVILACGVAVGILFLEETHETKRYDRDIGLEAGKWILRKFRRTSYHAINDWKAADAGLDASHALVEDEPPPGYRTTEGSPVHPSSRALSPLPNKSESPSSNSDDFGKHKPRVVQKTFNKQVVLNIIGYGILA